VTLADECRISNVVDLDPAVVIDLLFGGLHLGEEDDASRRDDG
jgi:hypothetical protein